MYSSASSFVVVFVTAPGCLVLVVIVIGWHKQIIFFQEIGHTFADRRTDEEARHHGAQNASQSKRNDMGHRSQSAIAVVRTSALAHTHHANCLSLLHTSNSLHQ